MESAGLRRKTSSAPHSTSDPPAYSSALPFTPSTLPAPLTLPTPWSTHWSASGHAPPRFTIDLSTAPSHRYDHIVPHFLPSLAEADVAGQFEELIEDFIPTRAGQKAVRAFTRVALRRVYGDEETEELRGISRGTGLPMHLLVALNVMLDLLLGCTSGGVRCQGKVVHFRTLDWGMDPLRKLIVELEYVRRPGGEVVARTVGYLGYVGVLTGVRRGLSVSLNYRPHHDRSTWWRRVRFRWHQAMVVFGRRRSVSSTLRGYLLEQGEKKRSIKDIMGEVGRSRSTAAYLIFCTPQRVYTAEKDNGSAFVQESAHFLATCNHDLVDELHPANLSVSADNEDVMAWLVADSLQRKQNAGLVWQTRRGPDENLVLGVGMDDVLAIVGEKGITNSMTHYAVVMDPESGKILWRRAYDVEDFPDSDTGSGQVSE
ncbi:beta subunit of N-acylethanolamine-hydrolyzing acid amidase-domain-containing protein [Lasiosphaeria hispida]|uniref:ceramidase n=1 Tax=Lasiosphaeria hispida TaxID=260671 RepID=A0AAJ0MD97_9PEZI|nr:beta subunit of N-acylethanolamine-hydrolyzing acid amidase-domain-containing protein [Lasiosphaeria hispida]